MDMQYCDSCGEVIQGKALETSTFGAKFMCEACQDNGGRKPTPQSTEDDMSLSTAMKGSNLELFSSDTIAKRREAPAKSSRLTLVDDQPQEASPHDDTHVDIDLSKKPSMSATNVELVTTLHQKAQQEDHTGSTFYVRKDSAQSGEHTTRAAAGSGSSAIASRAGAIKVRCVHCEAKLGIKPVAQKSKMKCPRCEGILIIDTDGTASKPQAGSAVTKKDTRPPAEVVSELASLLRGNETGPSTAPSPDTATARTQQIPLAAESPDEIIASVRDAVQPEPETSASKFESPLEAAAQATVGTATATVDYEETNDVYDEAPLDDTYAESPSEVDTPESAFLDKTESQEIQLQALLGAEERQQQVNLFPHQLPVRPEQLILGFFIASLPAFVGLGLIQVLDYPEYAEVLKGYGRVVQEHLVQVRQFLGI